MKKYAVITLKSNEERIAYPLGKYKAYTVEEWKQHIDKRLNEDGYVQIGIYGIFLESLKHYEIKESVS